MAQYNVGAPMERLGTDILDPYQFLTQVIAKYLLNVVLSNGRRHSPTKYQEADTVAKKMSKKLSANLEYLFPSTQIKGEILSLQSSHRDV